MSNWMRENGSVSIVTGICVKFRGGEGDVPTYGGKRCFNHNPLLVVEHFPLTK